MLEPVGDTSLLYNGRTACTIGRIQAKKLVRKVWTTLDKEQSWPR